MTSASFIKWILALSAYAAIPLYFLGGNSGPTLFQSLAALTTSLGFISACFCYGLYLQLRYAQYKTEINLLYLQQESLRLTAEPSKALNTLMNEAAKLQGEGHLAWAGLKSGYLFAAYGVLHGFLVVVSVMYLKPAF